MSNSEKLAFSILDHLSQYLNSGKISGDTAETLEVAIQCLEQVFKVENYDENQKELLKVDKPLQEIFDNYIKEHSVPETTADPTVMQPTAKDRERAEELKAEGNQLMKMEKYQDAISCYTQAIELDNTNPVYPCNRAAAYSKIIEHQKAVDDCKRALKLDPKYSKAYGRMALSYQNMNDLQKAKENYQKAIELEPENAFYQKNLKAVEDGLLGHGASGGARGGAMPGAVGAGMPNLGGMDFASLLSNPAVMNMAQTFMQSPQMQQMVSSMMTGGGMGGAMGGGMGAAASGSGGAGAGGAGAGGAGAGGMSQLFQAAQRFGEQLQESNPELMSELRHQAQETFNRNPGGNPFSSEHDKPEEKGDDQKD